MNKTAGIEVVMTTEEVNVIRLYADTVYDMLEPEEPYYRFPERESPLRCVSTPFRGGMRVSQIIKVS